MKKIFLIYPLSRIGFHYRPPLSLMYVASYYRNKGFKVEIKDFHIQDVVRNSTFLNTRQKQLDSFKELLLTDIACNQPDLIGISCYSTEYDEVVQLIHDIKKYMAFERNGYVREPKIKFVVGGIHPTLRPDQFTGISDYCVQGRLDDGLPAYDLVDMEYYTQANPYAIRGIFLRTMYVLGSFGCPGQCTFCVAKGLMKHYGKIQFKDPKVLYEEVKMLKDKYYIDGFYMIDDLYTSDKQKVLEFCSLIRKERLLWGCSSRVNTIDNNMLKEMSKSGCVQIDFGFERGSNEELKKIKKDITIEKIKETVRLCKENKIRVFANFIVGLPQESEKDRRDVEQIIINTRPEIVSINHFQPYLGCELYEQGCSQNTSSEINKFILRCMKKYNGIWVNLRFHLSWKYLSTIYRSKRRLDYWRQLWLLIRELMNQKV